MGELGLTKDTVDKAIKKRLEEWSKAIKERELTGDASLIDEI
jgi:hypothetical protein